MKVLYLAIAGEYTWHFVDEDYMFNEENREQLYKKCIDHKIEEWVATVKHASEVRQYEPAIYKRALHRAQDRSRFDNLDIYPVRFADNYVVELREAREGELE